jgi:hypothetical protein
LASSVGRTRGRLPQDQGFKFIRKDQQSQRAVNDMEAQMRTLKEMVINDQIVRFTRYKEGELFYRTSCGFEFPVPVADTGNATFLAEDKAILFMRYMRKEIERIESARVAQAGLRA